MLELPDDFRNNNLLAWVTANGAVSLAGYITDKPIALSWEQFTNVAPKLANSLKTAGIGSERMPDAWANNPELLNARAAGVYNQNLPEPLIRLGADAIARFKEGKHWSHQISYSEGIEKGLTPEQLADPSNGIFENGLDNIRRGAKQMPEGWGDKNNQGKLQIQFFNEVETLQIVCEQMLVNAGKGFMVGATYELILSTLEMGLAYQRGDINLSEAITNVRDKALTMGLKAGIAASVMTGICAYIPGAGIILSASSPVLVGLATVGTLFRVHNIISKHLTNQGFAQPVKFPFLDESLQDLQAKVNVVNKAVTDAMAQAKIMAQKYRQEKLNVEKWHQQALIYLSQGDELQARLALTHKHTSEKLVAEFQQNSDSLTQEINKLKENYSFLEKTISEVFHQQTVLETLNTFETTYHKALWHINDLQAKLKYFDYQLFQYESSLVILEK